MRRNVRRFKYRFFKPHLWRTRIVFWGGSILVGLIAAVFAMLSDHADGLFKDMASYNQYLPLLISPLGFVLGVYLTRKFFSGAEGSGIPQALIALGEPNSSISNRFLSMRMVVGKVLMCVLALFSGASLGREGPTVHLGSAILHSLGKYAHLPPKYIERGLIITGGGAGIAAAFNTPIAGIMFAIEELARSYDRRNSGMMLIGVVLAGMTAIIVHQDNYNYYGVTTVLTSIMHVWIGVVVCGLVGGLLGGIFSSVLIVGGRKLRPYMQKNWILVVAVCGLVVAILSIITGGISSGTGYHVAKHVVTCDGVGCHNAYGLMYPLYKALATIATYLSSLPAGIFAPSLATGAGLGANLSLLFPPEMASAIVLFGMVGYFAGVVQTPITAAVIVMEMTGQHSLGIAMLATSLLASGTSKFVCKKPIYEALAENFLATISESKKDKVQSSEA